MNPIKLLLVIVFTTFSMSVFGQADSTSFKVAGNCGMCKKRIEASVKGPAVTFASWNVKSKIMTIKFDPAKINPEQLQQKIVGVGHDTERFKAQKQVYDELPGCCLYDRTMLKTESTEAKEHSGH
jgi:periplasmic mercuric ion binding protein